ncbi:MAG TPA: HAMP domain-containing histidine kinase [Oscillatoriaceae cyanobacterium M7585_C2015_266]|nr:HAMP domain-containing histidine kinase [Oscillatoriaceae cyanobacterium M7585_C2015_266]
MIAEIAHEINNPIGCIYGNLQYVQKYFQGLLKIIEIYEKEISLPPQISESAAEIEVNYIKEDLPQLLLAMKIATERAKQLVYSLRNFSRLDEVKPHPVDLRSCLDSTLIILNSRIKNKIEVYCDYQEVPAAVEGYAGMLSQVFLNVISNAIEALEEKDSKEKREIRITTEKLNEKWVVVRIADNGVGITQENQAKIFDAFFTTKPQGIGTGLGLAISYQIIVEKHGGKINCYSQVGKGTEFVITLPVKFSLPAAAPISV